MSEILAIPQNLTQVKIEVYPGSTVAIELLLDSQIDETLLFRPTLDDWLLDNGQVICIPSNMSPPYLYIHKGSKLNQKIKFSIPFLLQPKQKIVSWLRFPGIQEEAIPIELEIVSPTSEKDKERVFEVPLEVTLPFTVLEGNSLWNTPDKTTAAIFGLMSGLMDLDKIPSRWLAAELFVVLCQKGEEYAQTESGRKLLDRLKLTRFYQNGVTAFASAQIPNWISDSIKSTSAILSGQSLLHIWQEWLLNIAPEDVKLNDKKGEFSLPAFLGEKFVYKLGGNADRWFGGILLGLAHISPAIAKKLQYMASTDRNSAGRLESDRATEATKSLVAGLPGLDTTPVRWLVLELLLLVCQQGDRYARTQAGSQLLTQLQRTDFFQNGVLAFASAEFPRWTVISQQAASAYHTYVAVEKGEGNLLYLGEQWLWSLLPTELKLSQAKDRITISNAAADNFVESVGMNAERWFSCVVLGLGLISPRIAALCQAIASSKNITSPLSKSAEQTILNDVFQEAGSLQR
ncbi:hypothetical protein H6S82_10045 [Planktothrix sp. FACHB-1355]|uniref:Uncharacterized protein n=1 Tax=Aerosakkonema funiforme FACHB-1375 TaxID=2949571 RepID=A0A926VE69_9CYAN|nr:MULTISPECIES: hypothetical protein [Oscillatoriales]MBD2181623.1 hypothetical protein [Aerosakkonema funiforme FACHB-1375]MBD3559201.1 hypothetical protein [Planktothrix sp. FACHB-1355]